MIFKKYFWPFEFIIYAAILCASVKAETLDETRRRLAQFEEMTPPMIPVMLDFVDNRYPQNINYNLKELRDRLFQFLYDKRIRINDSTFTQGIRPLYFTISLSYFGSYKTESGIWGRKGIAELKYGNSPISNQSERHPITSDQLYGRKNKSTQEGWEGLTIGDLCESIAQKIIEISKFEERSYQEVTALGVSAIAEKEEDDK